MLRRMIGAATFNAATYEEIEADQGALGQAVMVVLIVTLCGAIGGVLSDLFGGASLLGIVWGLIVGLTFGIVRWALWTSVIYLVGGRMLRTSGTETNWAELGRMLGFAYTPGVLSIFEFIPSVGWLFPLVGFFWTLAAVMVAVRQALDFESTGRAVLVTFIAGIIGLIPWAIVRLIGDAIAG